MVNTALNVHATNALLKKVEKRIAKGKIPNLGYFFNNVTWNKSNLDLQMNHLNSLVRELEALPGKILIGFKALGQLEGNPTMDRLKADQIKGQIKAVQAQFYQERDLVAELQREIAKTEGMAKTIIGELGILSKKVRVTGKVIDGLEKDFARVSNPILSMTYQQILGKTVELAAGGAGEAKIRSPKFLERLSKGWARGFGGWS
ncbi:hypothetical protein CL616_03645 [archaeon]|nr:hypothetical protein [archaeon]|tara:strand:- start:4089 stop:4697 length:609 start_codon:yes stop_codon:yes gene_type:complete